MKKYIVKTKAMLRRADFLIKRSVIQNKRFNIQDSILIFSDPRGGSTWLMEMLDKIPYSCTNWEPLHKEWGVVPKSFNFGWIPYLDPIDKRDEYQRFFEQMLTLELTSQWTLKYSTLWTILKSRFVITKFVKGNLLLPYFAENFHFKNPIIFLSRHPIDVCISQITAFEDRDKTIISGEIPEWINNERYVQNKALLSTLKDPLEIRIANWCINNKSTFERIESYGNKIIVVYYYDLIMRPEETMKKILDRLETIESKENEILSKINFRRISKTDFKGVFKKDPIEQLNKNINDLDEQTKVKIQNILDQFDINIYKADKPEPLYRFKNSI